MTTPVAENPTSANETPTQETTDESQQLGEGGKKAIQAEREARKAAEKDAADLKARLDALEAEKLSDLEKAQLVAKQEGERAAKAEREALRFKYAAKHGISEEDAALFLTGETEDAVAAQAERLAAHAKGAQRRNEQEALTDPTQGGGGGSPIPPVAPGVPRLADAFATQMNSRS